MSTSKTVISHLRRLEAESIHIIREVAAEFANPVMLYSVGKDSGVMLHLAMKAFYPSKPPFPLMHVNTTWKFKEMIAFRDQTVKRLGLDFIEYINQDGLARGINPFDSGSSLHTQVMKTEALKQALDMYKFDAAFGGARRDEEKESRQGAHLLVSQRFPRLGPQEPAARTLARLQHTYQQRRKYSGLPALQLDRAGHLAIYPGGEDSHRAAVLSRKSGR